MACRTLHAKFHFHRCNVSPLRGEKPQNRPLSKLNTNRLALRAMLPVIIIIIINDNVYGAVLMTMVTARVHPIHLMNAD